MLRSSEIRCSSDRGTGIPARRAISSATASQAITSQRSSSEGSFARWSAPSSDRTVAFGRAPPMEVPALVSSSRSSSVGSSDTARRADSTSLGRSTRVGTSPFGADSKVSPPSTEYLSAPSRVASRAMSRKSPSWRLRAARRSRTAAFRSAAKRSVRPQWSGPLSARAPGTRRSVANVIGPRRSGISGHSA